MSQQTPRARAIVWSDDFSGGKLDGWTIRGNFAAGKTLKTLDCPTCYQGLNVASHPSPIAYGTWSFDVYISSALEPRMLIMFVSDCPPDMPLAADCEIHVYMLEVLEYSHTVLNLIKLTGKGENQTPSDLASYRATRDISGWQHVDITRDTDGRFRVYLNRKLVMDVVDKSITTSQNFAFLAPGGKALNHIVVSKAIDVAL